MSVAARPVGSQLTVPAGSAGRIQPGSVPATNVRHWDPGNVVARPGVAESVAAGTGMTVVAGGPVRNIIAPADYFLGAPANQTLTATLRLQLGNAARFALTDNGDGGASFGVGNANAALSRDQLGPEFRSLVAAFSSPLWAPTAPGTAFGFGWNEAWFPDTAEVMSPIQPLVVDIPIPQEVMAIRPTHVPAIPLDAVGNPIFNPEATTSAALPTGSATWTWNGWTHVGTCADIAGTLSPCCVVYNPSGNILFDGTYHYWLGSFDVNPTVWVTADGEIVYVGSLGDEPADSQNLATDPVAVAWSPAAQAIGPWLYDLFYRSAGGSVRNNGLAHSQHDLLAFGYVGVDAQGVVTTAVGEQVEFFAAALIAGPGGSGAYADGRVAWLEMFITDGFPRQHIGGSFAVPIPIEFITNGDTNDDPVYVSFIHHHGHGQAGQIVGRTELTEVTESRVNISLDGDPRSFHRYGVARVGNGIRFSEGVQSAFNQNDWYVVIDIITPGFFWTGQSTSFAFDNRYDAGIHIASNGDITTGGGAPFITYVGAADTRNNHNRRIEFGVNLPNANNGNRLVNDWFQVGVDANNAGLFIGADDRARPGPVEAEVRFYTADTAFGLGGNVITGRQWSISSVDQLIAGNFIPGTVNSLVLDGAWGWISAQVNLLLNNPLGTSFDVYWMGGSSFAQVPLGAAGPSGNVGFVATFTISPIATGTGVAGRWGPGNLIEDEVITIANFGNIGLEFELYEGHDAEDFILRSGAREWNFAQEAGDWSGFAQADRRPIGAVIGDSVDDYFHRTARAILRETVAGSMPGTGAAPIRFTFENEGVQVLGVRLETNDAHFSRRDGRNENDTDEFVWFGYEREADNFLATTLNRNEVIIRPEIGFDEQRRFREAEIAIDFFLSVMPGYEHYFGYDDIEVTASASVDGHDWEETLTIAFARDPITVDIVPVTLDTASEAAWGLVRDIPLNNVVVTEVLRGDLEPGTRIGISAEGGLSRLWGGADQITVGATNVRIDGCTNMQVSSIRQDNFGAYVEVTRPSREDGVTLTFENVSISGRVIPEQNYNILTVDTAVAANWDGFSYGRRDFAWGVGFNRGAVRGFFDNEPYATEAFEFEGADVYAPAPAPAPGPADNVQRINAPVTFNLNSSHTTRDGDLVAAPVFTLVPNITNPDFVTSYVSARVVADLAGLPWGPGFSGWDPATQTATFSDGTNTVTFTNGATTATVNGVQQNIVAGGLAADARVVGDRMFVPISFFNTLGHIFPISVRWNPYDPANAQATRSITITPAP